MTNGKCTMEQEPMIDIIAARQSHCRFEIFAVELIRGEENPSSGLSKLNCSKMIDHLMTIGIDDATVEQRI